MCGCFGSGGRSGSDDIDVALRPRAFQTLVFGSRADISDRHLVEASFDARGQIPKNEFSNAPRVTGGLGALRPGLALAEANRAFESAHHITQPNVRRAARQAVATLRPALGANDARALQILKDLLQEAGRDVLPLRDVLDLG